jgi:hydroxymethylglutaryl-CoA lyase
VPTHVKIELIQRLYGVGLRSIEVTSTVSPKAISQLKDCQQVLADSSIQSLLLDSSLKLLVLVPNTQSLDIAARLGSEELPSLSAQLRASAWPT